MEYTLFKEIIIILGLSVFVVLIFQRFRLPTILGFLLTGVIAGPHGLQLVDESESVHMLSETGVILLLFVIGLEFSLRDLLAMRRTVLLGGGIQMGLTTLITLGVVLLLGMDWRASLFMGFCVALSSTAIVLRMFQEQNLVMSPQGKISLGVLIFQDIIVAPLMLLTPILAGQGGNVWEALGMMLGKTGLVLVVLYLGARFVLPRLLDEVARTRSRELFVLTTVLLCFAIAGLTYSMGLSLALGAFLAGLLISESDYSHQATGNVLPFREVFTSFFFVSVGMLLDAMFFFQHILPIVALALLVMVVKVSVAALAALALRYPLRTALLSGLALFQVGEFAFILSQVGERYRLIGGDTIQYFLAISILTMALTPFVMQQAGRIADLLARAPMARLMELAAKQDLVVGDAVSHDLRDHLIIIGYGLNGTNVALAAKSAHIPYVILEMNPETVRAERQKGEPIIYGDAADPFILEHVRVYQARVAVVAISDPQATRKIVSSIRGICRTVHIIVRTRFVREIEELLKLGADEVIPEEFETSIEIFTRALNKYLVPEDQIASFSQQIRAANYDMLRPEDRRRLSAGSLLNIPDLRISCLTVQQDVPQLTGRTLAESQLRQQYALNLVAIQRDGQLISEIGPDTEIRRDDFLYVIGKPDDISAFNQRMKA
ncbi:MAG: cation:proton antiporter [Bacteroidia bacterium]